MKPKRPPKRNVNTILNKITLTEFEEHLKSVDNHAHSIYSLHGQSALDRHLEKNPILLERVHAIDPDFVSRKDRIGKAKTEFRKSMEKLSDSRVRIILRAFPGAQKVFAEKGRTGLIQHVFGSEALLKRMTDLLAESKQSPIDQIASKKRTEKVLSRMQKVEARRRNNTVISGRKGSRTMKDAVASKKDGKTPKMIIRESLNLLGKHQLLEILGLIDPKLKAGFITRGVKGLAEAIKKSRHRKKVLETLTDLNVKKRFEQMRRIKK